MRSSIAIVIMGFTGLFGCEALTAEEALQALEEVSLSSQALTLASGSVEIATDFTIGQAVEAAAEEIRDFISAQLPCAEIELSGATLSIVYGAKPGICTYNGLRYDGEHTITISSTSSDGIELHHEWISLSNGKLEVSGTADVTWSAASESRKIIHELTWKKNGEEDAVVGKGERTQRALPLGVLDGIQVDGRRDWKSLSGMWKLEIDGVEVRWQDPVPQAGQYTLDTPFDKSVDLLFERQDENTIRVTISSGRREFEFNVSKLGIIS